MTHCNTLQHAGMGSEDAVPRHKAKFKVDESVLGVSYIGTVLQCVAVCCSVLQCVAVCCSVLQGGRECSGRQSYWYGVAV